MMERTPSDGLGINAGLADGQTRSLSTLLSKTSMANLNFALRSDHARRAGYHRHRFQIESTWRLVVPRAQQRLHPPDCVVRVTA